MAALMTQQNSNLPIAVQQAAVSQQLGAFVKRYPGVVVRPTLSLIFIIGCVAAVSFVLEPTIQPDPSLFQSQSAWWGVLVVLVMFAIIVSLILEISDNARKKVYLFQQGIIVRNKGQIHVFPWNLTAQVFQRVTRYYRNGFYMGTTYKYTLRHMKGGEEIKLDNGTRGIAKLGKAIVQGVTQAQLPPVLQSILAGQTVTFGPFSINLQGISEGSNLIPWQQVKAVKLNKGQVTIKKAGMFSYGHQTAIAKIPNVFVFVALSQEMIRKTSSS